MAVSATKLLGLLSRERRRFMTDPVGHAVKFYSIRGVPGAGASAHPEIRHRHELRFR